MDLANALLHRWSPRGAYSLGIFNCRRIAGSSSYSVHAEGRAFDLGIPSSGRPALGDAVLTELLLLDPPILQRVIWWHAVYDADSPQGRPYGGSSPHEDHLHIEMPWATADGLTAAQIAQLLGEDDVTEDQLKTAIRTVLNEGTGNGQRTWAGTSGATLATVQGLHNQLVALAAAVAKLTPPG